MPFLFFNDYKDKAYAGIVTLYAKDLYTSFESFLNNYPNRQGSSSSPLTRTRVSALKGYGTTELNDYSDLHDDGEVFNDHLKATIPGLADSTEVGFFISVNGSNTDQIFVGHCSTTYYVYSTFVYDGAFATIESGASAPVQAFKVNLLRAAKKPDC